MGSRSDTADSYPMHICHRRKFGRISSQSHHEPNPRRSELDLFHPLHPHRDAHLAAIGHQCECVLWTIQVLLRLSQEDGDSYRSGTFIRVKTHIGS